MKVVLLNVLFYLLWGCCGLCIFLVMTLSFLLACPFLPSAVYLRWQRFLAADIFGRSYLFFLRPIAPVSTSGLERLGKNPVPRIYVLNHKSFSDTFLCSLLPTRSPIVLFNRTVSRIPIMGMGVRFFKWINVDELPFDDWCESVIAQLRAGSILCCFPEGTRSGKGPMGAFHSGVFRLAAKAGFPVTPVLITGNEETPAKGSPLLKPAHIRFSVLPDIAQEEGETPFHFKERVRGVMREQLAKLEGTLDAG
ncbi:MAG: 1-acyl-sn-glycerol-3-phosphate acyltransferase [Kiritimatiellae bacterium]|nr:1-acyl-sn-glycerol-3-phosphate acyltransferase [Kiritimatiellia bacterium]